MEEQEEIIMTRKGYALKDLAYSFTIALSEAGPAASGKLLHYTADMICSGGLHLWQRLCWDHAFEHIGIASPRIFVYIQKKFRELNDIHAKFPFEVFCKKPEVQQGTVEIVLILQTCSRKTKVKMPVVPKETHMNSDWLNSVLRASDKAAVKKVWDQSQDLPELLYASNELIAACIEGATEKALFWMRWILEEDTLLRKKLGGGLTNMERGPAVLNPRQRSHPGFYLCAVFAEAYKELAEKYQIRMHEEYQILLDIYRSPDKTITPRRKMDCLILLIHILTDVPRWKVPAAPSLVKDPIVLQRAVAQAETFYREILMLPPPQKPLPNKVGSLKPKKKHSKQDELEEHLNDMDKMIMDFYGVK